MNNTVKSQNRISGLERIAAKARTHRTEKFNNLMHHITMPLLEASIKEMAKRTSPGVGSLNRDATLEELYWLGPKALDAAHKGRYQARPVKRVMIPKADGRERPIGVPTVLDRGLQKAVARVLECIYEQDFLKVSFGFRPGKNCHQALATLSNSIQWEGLKYALEVDIRDFFGSLDHGWLRKFLRLRIGDPRILKLIDAWLKAGVIVKEEWEETTQGAAQGGSLSPLLANIYLHYVLDLWFEVKAKRKLKGRARLVRYCDDFVILFENEEDRNDFLPKLKERFREFKLEIAENKTHITDVVVSKQDKTHKRRAITFLGVVVYRARNRAGTGSKTVFRTEGKRLRKAKEELKARLMKNRHLPLEEQARHLNWMLRGHYNYYGLPGNFERLQEMGHWAIKMWRKALSKRSQKGKLSWDKINHLMKTQWIVKPKLKIRYGDLQRYVVL